ncbi:MAG: pyridoxine 5'-phosphate synthase [SAR324 cluster bacterium]|uniref:Pyridoxine 5'-phosphate synthase n=1 Tax=SAR324 cluster bacterium TaxID=2024889 RepID=A0A2A4T226_9DELT|nr:MAG: pyridoxine 5'-phosphate synthase [SAR324 cluster bacterium]
MKTKLSVNLNKIALLRNSRGRNYPSVEGFARKALAWGVAGITMHPRPDQRHATYEDVFELSKVVTEYPGAELNIEGYPTDDFLEVVLKAKPEQCTLVPDEPNQVTSDHGWDVKAQGEFLKPIITQLQDAGVRVSLFMDPDVDQISIVKDLGAERIELYTEEFASTYSDAGNTEVLNLYRKATEHALNLGLDVNAGHDLNLENLGQFLTIEGIAEVSIGHAIIVESLEMGFESTIKQYLQIIND